MPNKKLLVRPKSVSCKYLCFLIIFLTGVTVFNYFDLLKFVIICLAVEIYTSMMLKLPQVRLTAIFE